MLNVGSLFQKKTTPRSQDRLAAWILLMGSTISVLFWSCQIGLRDFSEPLQVAQVGHFASWRRVGPQRHIIAVGTTRRDNDIVLHDRKASGEHFVLERRGGKGHRWAQLNNRSRDRRIMIRRQKGGTVKVNRHRLRDGDHFLLPLQHIRKNASFQGLRKIDWCQPSQLLQLLRTSPPPKTTASKTKTPKPSKTQKKRDDGQTISFTIQASKLPIRWNEEQLLFDIKGKQPRQMRLGPHQYYRLPKEVKGDALAYRYGQWRRLFGTQWKPFTGTISWGKQPSYNVSLQHKTYLTTAPGYTLTQTNTSCPFPLRESAIPGGLEIAGIARLYFQNKRLLLQHLGQGNRPMQILPGRGSARLLGTTSLYDGDLLSAGQLTYRLSFTPEGVRMMLTRLPKTTLIPFFSTYPSHNYPMRRFLPEGRHLLITGGGGGNPQADRWTIRTSLVGEPGKTQLVSPYRPFMEIQPDKKGHLQVRPLEGAALYLAKADGTLLKKLPKAGIPHKAEHIYYTKRFYFRVFRPSYAALAWRIALLWGTIFMGLSLFLYWMLTTGRVTWSPIPPSSVLMKLLPEGDLRQALLTRTQRRMWRASEEEGQPLPALPWYGSLLMFALWFPAMLLLPVAIFLNGMGLYVLATLSLSSLGLNNNDFLYRQLLWSLVGFTAFVGLFILPRDIWQRVQDWRTRDHIKQAIEPEFAPTPLFETWEFRGFALVCLVCAIFFGWLFGTWLTFLLAIVVLFCGSVLMKEFERARQAPLQRKSLRFFFYTLALLGFVPLLGLLIPGAVHNRFFLVIPLIGTVKLSDFAILAAIYFFSGYLGHELFALRLRKARHTQQRQREAQQLAQPGERTATLPEQKAVQTFTPQERGKILFGAMQLSMLYLFLLGAICVLYTIQGDLGPGLILTLCFSLYILFIFLAPGVDRLVTAGNLLRIGVVFGGIAVLFWLPDLLATLQPEWALHNSELQKVRERLALWNQPWRFMVGEQLLQNQWDLAGYKGAFQWFNNLHSDFVLTAVVRVLSPLWGYIVLLTTCAFPLMTLGVAWLHWYPLFPKAEGEASFGDNKAALAYKKQSSIRSLLMLFGSIYLFAQNFIHIGSTLRLTPMTGVTLTWVSSGGTSLVACYFVLALIYRQMHHHPWEPAEEEVS